jgi:hypothetical protein
MQAFKDAVFALRDEGKLGIDDDGYVTLPAHAGPRAS